MKTNQSLIIMLAMSALSLTGGQVSAQPHEEQITLELRSQVRRTHILTPASPTFTAQIVLEDVDTARWIFGSPSKTLAIELVAPNGETIVAGAPDTPSALTRIFPDPADPDTKGANYLFALTDPVPGTWSYEIRETVTLTAPRAVLLDVFPESEVRSGILGGGEYYRLDREVRLALVTVEGPAVLDSLTIDATLSSSDGAPFTPIAVDFRDDGLDGDETAADGMYTASFLPGVTGAFDVVATVTGATGAGDAFERSASAFFQIRPVRASLSGLFSDRGIDLDADGLLDQIGVTPNLDVLTAGDYNVVVVLEASNGTSIAGHLTATLPAGIANPEVLFSTADVKDHLDVDGPYTLSEVRLEYLEADPPPTVDAGFDLGQTAAYTLGQLQREAIEFLAGGTAAGRDTNANGQFDFLDVSLPVDFLRSGFYRWSARLVDANSTELGLASRSGSFGAGPATLSLTFSGRAIGENGVDGPYLVKNLIIFGAGESLIVDDPLTTQAFNASEFEGFIFDQEPPELDVAATPDVLWPPNHEMIEISIDVTVSDNVDPNPLVRLESIESSEGDNAIGDGNTSDDILIDSAGVIFLRAERSGTGGGRVYTLTYSARDAAGNVAYDTVEVRVPKSQGQRSGN